MYSEYWINLRRSGLPGPDRTQIVELGSEGWGFESLQAASDSRRSPAVIALAEVITFTEENLPTVTAESVCRVCRVVRKDPPPTIPRGDWHHVERLRASEPPTPRHDPARVG